MYKTDLNGCPIEVTDIKETIRIAAEYNTYRHEDRSFATFDKKQAAYWTDLHKKLLALELQKSN